MVHSLITCNQFSYLFVLGEKWFLTAGPMVGIPMILAEFPERKNCESFFPNLTDQRFSKTKLMNWFSGSSLLNGNNAAGFPGALGSSYELDIKLFLESA